MNPPAPAPAPAAPPVPRLTHLALHVADLGKSVDFYTRVAGMRLVHERIDATTGVAVAWVTTCAADAPLAFAIVLIADAGNALGYGAPQAPIGPLSHLGFGLNSRAGVDAIAARAQAAGVLQQAAGYVNEVVGYICMLRDPDGHTVEFSHGQDFEHNSNVG